MQQWNISYTALALSTLVLSLVWGGLLWICVPPSQVGGSVVWVPLFLLGVVALVASVVDWQSHLLPDVFTLYAGIPAVLLYAGALAWSERLLPFTAHLWMPPLLGAALGFALVKGLQLLLRRKSGGQEQMGSGDVKLMLVLGALVGPTGLLPTLIFACLLLYPLLKLRKSPVLPFGPSLTLSALAVFLLGLQWPV